MLSSGCWFWCWWSVVVDGGGNDSGIFSILIVVVVAAAAAAVSVDIPGVVSFVSVNIVCDAVCVVWMVIHNKNNVQVVL